MHSDGCLAYPWHTQNGCAHACNRLVTEKESSTGFSHHTRQAHHWSHAATKIMLWARPTRGNFDALIFTGQIAGQEMKSLLASRNDALAATEVNIKTQSSRAYTVVDNHRRSRVGFFCRLDRQQNVHTTYIARVMRSKWLKTVYNGCTHASTRAVATPRTSSHSQLPMYVSVHARCQQAAPASLSCAPMTIMPLGIRTHAACTIAPIRSSHARLRGRL